jgi:hypothetical protein
MEKRRFLPTPKCWGFRAAPLMIVSLFYVTVPAEAAERFEQSWTQRAG